MSASAAAERTHAMLDQLANFRRVANLPDGTRVLLRPMQPADRQGVADLFAQAPREDLRFLRQKVTDPGVIERWFASHDLRSVFPLLAIVTDHVVGDATLHVGEGPHRHLAWMRIYVAPERFTRTASP